MSKFSRFIAPIGSALTYFVVVSSVYAQDGSLKSVGVDPTAVKPEAIPQFIINSLFMVAAFLAVLYLMYGGVKWITSRGDKMAVEAARKHIVAAVLGLVVVAGSFFALNVVFTVLGACNPLTKGFTLPTLKTVSQSSAAGC